MWRLRRRASIQDLFLITDGLRETLHALGVAVNAQLCEPEIDRLLSEAAADQLSAKSYCFFNSSRLQIAGYVDEYEPETVWIRVEGILSQVKAYTRFLDDRRLLVGPGSPIR